MMGMAGKLEKIASQIHKMDNKEHAKEFSRQLDAIEKHSYICQANVSNFEQ